MADIDLSNAIFTPVGTTNITTASYLSTVGSLNVYDAENQIIGSITKTTTLDEEKQFIASFSGSIANIASEEEYDEIYFAYSGTVSQRKWKISGITIRRGDTFSFKMKADLIINSGTPRTQLSVPVYVSIHNYNYERGMANFEDALINPYTYESWPHEHMYFDYAALYNSGSRVNNNSATRTILSDSPRSISLLYTGILSTDVSSFTIGAQNIWRISNINYPAHSNIPYSFKVDLEIG